MKFKRKFIAFFLTAFMLASSIIPTIPSNFATPTANIENIYNIKIDNILNELYKYFNTQIINTQRLMINLTTIEDSEILQKYFLDQNVTKYLYYSPFLLKFTNASIPPKENFLPTTEFIKLSLTLKDTKEVVGQITIERSPPVIDYEPTIELSYYIGSAYQGKGYATEALLKINEILSKSKIKFAKARLNEKNIACKKLLEKLDAKQDKIYEQHNCIIERSKSNPDVLLITDLGIEYLNGKEKSKITIDSKKGTLKKWRYKEKFTDDFVDYIDKNLSKKNKFLYTCKIRYYTLNLTKN